MINFEGIKNIDELLIKTANTEKSDIIEIVKACSNPHYDVTYNWLQELINKQMGEHSFSVDDFIKLAEDTVLGEPQELKDAIGIIKHKVNKTSPKKDLELKKKTVGPDHSTIKIDKMNTGDIVDT